MWRSIGLVVGGVLLATLALWVLLVVSLRTKFTPVLTAIRRINNVLTNQRAMKTAGQPGVYASVIHHVGRTTDTPYETPVGVVETEDGFVIGLPYGTSTDWLKNVLAAGSATIVSEGSVYRVEDPELVPAADAIRHFSRNERRIHRLYGVDQLLFLRRAGADVAPGAHP